MIHSELKEESFAQGRWRLDHTSAILKSFMNHWLMVGENWLLIDQILSKS